MTKLLYTKQEIIDKSSIIAGLVAEINLRDDKLPSDEYKLWMSVFDDSIVVVIIHQYEVERQGDVELRDEDIMEIRCGLTEGFDPTDWGDDVYTLDQAIEKLTNFKWSGIDEK